MTSAFNQSAISRFARDTFWQVVANHDVAGVARMLAAHPGIHRCGVRDSKDFNDGDQALHIAARAGHVDFIATFLSLGAGLEDRNAVTGETPLIAAARQGQDEAVRHLLAKGADINARDSRGCTGLWQASQRGLDHTVKVMMDNGADPNFADTDGRTALTVALEGYSIDAAERLLGDPRTRADTTDECGNSPRSLADEIPGNGPKLQNLRSAIQRRIAENHAADERAALLKKQAMVEEIGNAVHRDVDMTGKTMAPLRLNAGPGKNP